MRYNTRHITNKNFSHTQTKHNGGTRRAPAILPHICTPHIKDCASGEQEVRCLRLHTWVLSRAEIRRKAGTRNGNNHGHKTAQCRTPCPCRSTRVVYAYFGLARKITRRQRRPPTWRRNWAGVAEPCTQPMACSRRTQCRRRGCA